MPRRKKGRARSLRSKINLTIHPDIQEWAKLLARRRTIGQLFEDLVEAEWARFHSASQTQGLPAYSELQPLEQAAQVLANYRYRQAAQQQQQ